MQGTGVLGLFLVLGGIAQFCIFIELCANVRAIRRRMDKPIYLPPPPQGPYRP